MKERKRERKKAKLEYLEAENSGLKRENNELIFEIGRKNEEIFKLNTEIIKIRDIISRLERNYRKDFKQKRAGFMISKRFENIYGEQMARNIAKNEIGYQLRAFLDECELKIEDCNATKRYYFDFWIEQGGKENEK